MLGVIGSKTHVASGGGGGRSGADVPTTSQKRAREGDVDDPTTSAVAAPLPLAERIRTYASAHDEWTTLKAKLTGLRQPLRRVTVDTRDHVVKVMRDLNVRSLRLPLLEKEQAQHDWLRVHSATKAASDSRKRLRVVKLDALESTLGEQKQQPGRQDQPHTELYVRLKTVKAYKTMELSHVVQILAALIERREPADAAEQAVRRLCVTERGDIEAQTRPFCGRGKDMANDTLNGVASDELQLQVAGWFKTVYESRRLQQTFREQLDPLKKRREALQRSVQDALEAASAKPDDFKVQTSAGERTFLVWYGSTRPPKARKKLSVKEVMSVYEDALAVLSLEESAGLAPSDVAKKALEAYLSKCAQEAAAASSGHTVHIQVQTDGTLAGGRHANGDGHADDAADDDEDEDEDEYESDQ